MWLTIGVHLLPLPLQGIDTEAHYPYTAADGECNKRHKRHHVVSIDGWGPGPGPCACTAARTCGQAPNGREGVRPPVGFAA